MRKIYRAGEVEVHALRGVEFAGETGEFLSIVGPSGSGKSTLFNILGGLTPPTSGKALIHGYDLVGIGDHQRTEMRKSEVGFVFQKYNLLPTLTAGDNIEIARDIAGQTGIWISAISRNCSKCWESRTGWIISRERFPAVNSSASRLRGRL